MSKLGDECAFPTGLTKREYIATHVFAPLVASPETDELTLVEIAVEAVRATDVLLSALESTNQ